MNSFGLSRLIVACSLLAAWQMNAQTNVVYSGITSGPTAPVDVQYYSGDGRSTAYSSLERNHGFNTGSETEDYGWSMGVSSQFNEGGTNFTATNIHTDSGANLSGGGSYRYVMGWSPGINRGIGTAGDNGNQVLQLGLINTATFVSDQYFGTTDSFYLTGFETNWTTAATSGQTYTSQFNYPGDPGFYPVGSQVPVGILTLELRLSDEVGNILANLGEFNFKYTADNYAEQMIFYLFDMNFQLNADGTFAFNVSADEYHQFVDSEDENGRVLAQSNYLSASTSGANHNLQDLSSLYAAFGISVIDNVNVGNTGATYDSIEPIAVPEPSGALLLCITGMMCLLKRRRRVV